MPRLIFSAADVRRVVEHSIGSPEQALQTVGYDDAFQAIQQRVAAPAILLVHDEGVYLMSNGLPADRDTSRPTTEPRTSQEREGEKYFRRYVAYARGCDPHKDGGYYDTARDLVGGDDFVETLPWAEEIFSAIVRGATEIAFVVTGNDISFEARKTTP